MIAVKCSSRIQMIFTSVCIKLLQRIKWLSQNIFFFTVFLSIKKGGKEKWKWTIIFTYNKFDMWECIAGQKNCIVSQILATGMCGKYTIISCPIDSMIGKNTVSAFSIAMPSWPAPAKFMEQWVELSWYIPFPLTCRPTCNRLWMQKKYFKNKKCITFFRYFLWSFIAPVQAFLASRFPVMSFNIYQWRKERIRNKKRLVETMILLRQERLHR